MIKKRNWTKEEERAYWQQKRQDYIAMSRRMLEEPDYEWRDPLAFYRDIFPEDFLQECWTDEQREEFDGKPNAIALKFGPKTRKKKIKGKLQDVSVQERFTITDDLDGVAELVKKSIAENAPVYMAPVSWYGKHNRAVNARFLHAFAVDLDGVTPDKLGNLLKQMRNGRNPKLPKSTSLPQATYIVMSGRGLHLYYLLERPVPMIAKLVPFLQSLKRRLTEVVWTDFTSDEERQYQGIYQGFRMPGTTTRLNGHGIEDKTSSKYEALAFMYSPHAESEPARVSLDYLVDYCGIRGEEIPDELRWIFATGGRTPIAEAKEKWPEWYERRVVNNGEKKTYVTGRAAYDSWLNRILNETESGGRYFAVLSLVAYAMKCGVSFKEVEHDAYELVEWLDAMTDNPRNHFTDYDVACALAAYGDQRLFFWKNEYMSRRAKMKIKTGIKHNWQKQADHLEEARAQRDIKQRRKGKNWWDNGNRDGAPTKADLIRTYAAEHPEASQRQIAKALGVSPTTVNKWLKPDAPAAGAAAKEAENKAGTLEDKLRDHFELIKAHAMSGEIEGGQIELGAITDLGGIADLLTKKHKR